MVKQQTLLEVFSTPQGVEYALHKGSSKLYIRPALAENGSLDLREVLGKVVSNHRVVYKNPWGESLLFAALDRHLQSNQIPLRKLFEHPQSGAMERIHVKNFPKFVEDLHVGLAAEEILYWQEVVDDDNDGTIEVEDILNWAQDVRRCEASRTRLASDPGRRLALVKEFLKQLDKLLRLQQLAIQPFFHSCRMKNASSTSSALSLNAYEVGTLVRSCLPQVRLHALQLLQDHLLAGSRSRTLDFDTFKQHLTSWAAASSPSSLQQPPSSPLPPPPHPSPLPPLPAAAAAAAAAGEVVGEGPGVHSEAAVGGPLQQRFCVCRGGGFPQQWVAQAQALGWGVAAAAVEPPTRLQPSAAGLVVVSARGPGAAPAVAVQACGEDCGAAAMAQQEAAGRAVAFWSGWIGNVVISTQDAGSLRSCKRWSYRGWGFSSLDQLRNQIQECHAAGDLVTELGYVQDRGVMLVTTRQPQRSQKLSCSASFPQEEALAEEKAGRLVSHLVFAAHAGSWLMLTSAPLQQPTEQQLLRCTSGQLPELAQQLSAALLDGFTITTVAAGAGTWAVVLHRRRAPPPRVLAASSNAAAAALLPSGLEAGAPGPVRVGAATVADRQAFVVTEGAEFPEAEVAALRRQGYVAVAAAFRPGSKSAPPRGVVAMTRFPAAGSSFSLCSLSEDYPQQLLEQRVFGAAGRGGDLVVQQAAAWDNRWLLLLEGFDTAGMVRNTSVSVGSSDPSDLSARVEKAVQSSAAGTTQLSSSAFKDGHALLVASAGTGGRGTKHVSSHSFPQAAVGAALARGEAVAALGFDARHWQWHAFLSQPATACQQVLLQSDDWDAAAVQRAVQAGMLVTAMAFSDAGLVVALTKQVPAA